MSRIGKSRETKKLISGLEGRREMEMTAAEAYRLSFWVARIF